MSPRPTILRTNGGEAAGGRGRFRAPGNPCAPGRARPSWRDRAVERVRSTHRGTPMIILYSSPSTASLVAHWLLIELDLPHEVRNLDLGAREQKSPEYLRLNPAGVVPTLVLDGQVICEAAAILMHLADLHANASLAPTPGSAERAQYYQWMFFLANTLQPAYRAW